MPNIKLTIGRVFSYLVATESQWPRISSILQNFLRYPLSCFSPKIYLQDLWKRFQFVLDQNLGHFEANLFDRAKIVMQAILCLSKMAKPDLITCTRHHLARLLKYYPRPSCAPSFIKSRKLPNTTNTFLTFLKFRYVFTRGTIGCLLGFWPPARNPAGAIKSSIMIVIDFYLKPNVK